ncbi:MAG: MarR family transcriptional regulator [Methylotenera sp.]|nr:MarR family transcriptional regulator [Methylotenera sp.]MDP1753970.1 MarR family transcriptional regulator [Methylotenera sp.]MDP1960191.1 MarR family transcriptional regulator [Methylotenera sp.]MDP3206690.1 MarR family transcriptional regulator [Methylotenera sp.]MDP3303204.1 MarR family transcriptional regulator [Methylotenera sp.]
MLQLRDLPTTEVLTKFAERYPDADITAVSSFLHLLRVATDLSTALDTCLSKYGLLQGRWWVLILLMREESRTSTPSALADKAGVTRATMTGLIDGLEQSGLVVRVYAKDDRRSVLISLTDAGQAKLDVVMPDYYRRLRQCMQALDEEKRSQLKQMLGLINSGISAFIE